MDLLSAYVEAVQTPGSVIRATNWAIEAFYHPKCALRSRFCRGLSQPQPELEVVQPNETPHSIMWEAGCNYCSVRLVD